MNYALVGTGRMGRAIRIEADRHGHRCTVALGRDRFGEALAGGDLASRLEGAEVAFEFTAPDAARDNVVALLEAGVAVICGTTGWTPDERLARTVEVAGVGLVLAPNFSVGMNLFCRLTRQAAQLFGSTGFYHPWVAESHHRHKRDLPSGTARRLGEILVESDPSLAAVWDGEPDRGVPRSRVHVSGVRRGSDPGTHTVGYDGEHDVITLTHGARSRAGFALGAVLAAEWIVGRRGRHEFNEVLDDRLAAGPRGGGAEGGER